MIYTAHHITDQKEVKRALSLSLSNYDLVLEEEEEEEEEAEHSSNKS